MTTLLLLAGLAQFAIAGASLGAPRVLDWRVELGRLRPLNRQIFTVYGYYILGTNLALGALCTFAPDALLDGSLLATAVCAYMLAYWGARLAIQFAYYDRADAPPGRLCEAAHYGFSALFLFLTVALALALRSNLGAP